MEFVPIIPRGATLQGDPEEASKTVCKISTYRLNLITFMKIKIVDSLSEIQPELYLIIQHS